jgi:hypothetical protein
MDVLEVDGTDVGFVDVRDLAVLVGLGHADHQGAATPEAQL